MRCSDFRNVATKRPSIPTTISLLELLPFNFMRRACGAISGRKPLRRATQRRSLLTLAIETSCDDTSIAVLEKHNNKSELHFHSKITSDNRAFQGVNPIVALTSHQENLAKLVNASLEKLPTQTSADTQLGNSLLVGYGRRAQLRKKPDFVTVTRGPGMRSNLNTGLDTAKGLAVAWQVPLLGVNHMQAHALTPRLVSSLDAEKESGSNDPEFPFLSLLVSGGHTMLVHSRGLCDHKILARTSDLAIGVMVDKCARDIIPSEMIEKSGNVMYGRLLEEFAFPQGAENYCYSAPASKGEEMEKKSTGYEWSITPPLSRTNHGSKTNSMEYSFSGIGSSVRRIMESNPAMVDVERRVLARETLRLAFEHLMSRLLIALQNPDIGSVNTVVAAGGVASNRFLKHILKATLEKRGFGGTRVIFPPPSLCTDNAAMIAWTGMEMWTAGWRSDLSINSLRKWAIDEAAEDGGILGADGWVTNRRV